MAPCTVVPFARQLRTRFAVSPRSHSRLAMLAASLSGGCAPCSLPFMATSAREPDAEAGGEAKPGIIASRGGIGGNCAEMLAGESTHEIAENAGAGQRVGNRMMERQDERRAVGRPQGRCPHERTRDGVEGP